MRLNFKKYMAGLATAATLLLTACYEDHTELEDRTTRIRISPEIEAFEADGHLVCRNVRDFIRLAVYADERGDDFTRFPVHDVHDPAEVARFAQVLTVFVRKLVFLVFIEFLLLADEVRHEADIAFTRCV